MTATPAVSDAATARKPLLEPATLIRRWGALVYELLVIAAVMLVAGFAILPLLGMPIGARGAEGLQILPPASRAFVFVYYVAVLGGYCVLFWTHGRRTVPMKTWHLALRAGDDRLLDARDAIKRYLAAWIGPAVGLVAYALLGRWGLVAAFLNYFWAWIDGGRLFLHDRIAGTRIVRIL